MKSVKEVERIIIDLVRPLTEQELIPLSQANQRILSQNISSELDFPYWDNSAMDGYAVRYDDVREASSTNPICLQIIEEIAAGYCPQKSIDSGETARIFTGGMMPKGADTVIMQENTRREGDRVFIFSSSHQNNFVRSQGSFYRARDCLLSAGVKINAPEIAILATAQCLNVPVIRKPKIAILSTGDELITPDKPLQPGKIIDSNQYLLASFLAQNNVTVLPLGIISDNFDRLKEAVQNALQQADWVISTGGVSVGEYDYVDRVLTELGGEIVITSVKMKPGKPLTVATFGENKLYFGIPGNPVSTMVTCWRFLQTAINKLSGDKNYTLPSIVIGKTKSNLISAGTRETYIWGRATLVRGYYQFSIAKGLSNSGNLIDLQEVNALAIVPVGTSLIEIGNDVEIMSI